jgi:hypothetical protein
MFSMGLDVELQDERGFRIDSIADPRNLLGRLLPAHDDQVYVLLSTIDPYGDTVFKQLQMKRFLSEWESVLSKARSLDERQLLLRIESLATRCSGERHTYLKFIGD